jgi:hypothetical protein
MSLVLPPRPNLARLKKEAKARLRVMRGANPAARLSEAQHVLARDYGFVSWPKLKAHVEAREQPAQPPSPPPPVPTLAGTFGRYTHRARQALFFSRFEAAQRGSAVIQSEHLLVGLLRAREGLPLAAPLALPPDGVRTAVEIHTTSAEPLPTGVVIPFAEPTTRALHRANDEAERRHHAQVGTMHLLLGILDEPSLTASRVLASLGVSYEALAVDPQAFDGES